MTSTDRPHLRIAHFVQRYPPALGGSESYFARLSAFLAHRGHSVTVFTTDALDLEAFWSPGAATLPAGLSHAQGVNICRYSLWRARGRRWLLKPLSLLPLANWRRMVLPCNPISLRMWRDAGRPTQPFDIVHATAFPYAWPIACGLRLANRLDIPFLVTPFLHLGDPARPRDPTRRAYTAPPLTSLLRRADRIFVQTPSEMAAVNSLAIPSERVVRLGMGVDLAECTGGDRETARRTWGIGPDEVVIGHLANNSTEKGSIDLLQAAARLRDRGVSCRVMLAGPEMPSFVHFWRRFQDRRLVIRLGRLSEGQKKDFFASIDIFALPSRSDSFGLVLLEAWANGAPCVGYRAGGIGDVIRTEQDGILVDCGDVSQLALALERLVKTPVLRQSLGAAGRARTANEFQWHDKLEKILNVYEAVARQLNLSPRVSRPIEIGATI